MTVFEILNFNKELLNRLTEIGYKAGLVSEEKYAAFCERKRQIEKEIERLSSVIVTPSKENNEYLASLGSSPISTGARLSELLRRPELDYDNLSPLDKFRPELPESVRLTAQINVKYDGYIKRELSEVEKQEKLENKLLPPDIDYISLKGLRIEAAQKLQKIRPLNIGQASRISGVNPADISVLIIYLGQKK